MFHEDSGSAALRFSLVGDAGERIQSWQQQLNRELIRRQIARQGRAIVIRFRSDHRRQAVTETPDPGEAEPWYGETGGLYTFTFKPRSGGCDIQVEMTDRGAIAVGALPVSASLMLRASATLELVVNVEHLHHPRWSRPDIWGAGTSMHELSNAQSHFWIDGEMYQRLVVLGWSWQQAHAYRYRFTPLSVGCDIVVQHVASGRELHLTRHISG